MNISGRQIRSAPAAVAFSKSGASISASIEEVNNLYKVTMRVNDSTGEVMCVCVSVKSRSEAEKIKSNFESKPDGVYRGVLFSVTGKLEFLS